jgi:hypothetical protein
VLVPGRAPALLVLWLLWRSAPLRGSGLADLPEPFDRVGAGLVVVACVGDYLRLKARLTLP